MATYTDNYQLTKPTYAEQADIGVINSNMNKIDNVMHSSQISLAPAYDQSQTYAEGDVVMYELLMYKCISPTTGVWDASKWERTTASESGGGGSAELDILGEGNGAVVSFSDGASAELAKCIADINPVQDLHGYDKPWAPGAGVNQWDEVWEVGAIQGSNGQPTTFSNRIRSVNYCPCTANTNYYPFIGFNVPLRIFWYESDYTFISYSTGGQVVTSPANAAYFKISTEGTTYGETYRNDIAVNSPSTVTTYSPYANICPISGHSSVTINVSPTSEPAEGIDTTIQLGDTYYGGTLNVGKGELTIDRAIVDLGSFNWISESATVSGLARVGVEEIRPLGALYNQTPICSSYEGVAPKGYSAFNNGEIGFSNNEANPMIRVRDQNFASMTDAQIKSAMNGVQLCYFLATPQTVQLTPQEVNSLLGQNNISADTGDIDIVYVKASAPIQPNPTGTPTATLKKLGIEGTVFELEDGGGGSSGINYSTTEQVIGTYLGKPLYQITISNISVPSNNTVNINTPVSIEHLVSCFGNAYTSDSSNQRPLPFAGGGTNDIRIDYVNGTLRIITFTTWTGYTADITIQYTKITD